MKNEKVTVVCPKCGHEQQEPALAYSTRCKECREHFRLEDVLRPAKKVVNHQGGRKQVSCFKCNTELEVPVTAMSTMCKRCGSHVDLRDYTIANAVSKNFKTKGRFVIEQGGFLFNTESVAGEAVIKGRFLGNLRAERSLEIYSSAEIKGHLTTGLLILPEGQRFPVGGDTAIGGGGDCRGVGGECARGGEGGGEGQCAGVWRHCSGEPGGGGRSGVSWKHENWGAYFNCKKRRDLRECATELLTESCKR